MSTITQVLPLIMGLLPKSVEPQGQAFVKAMENDEVALGVLETSQGTLKHLLQDMSKGATQVVDEWLSGLDLTKAKSVTVASRSALLVLARRDRVAVDRALGGSVRKMALALWK